jgi:NTE family protein
VSALAGQRVALVLGAGGARGLAHIGVIEVLQARGVKIEAVIGCSMGALVGGIFAAGKLDEYRDWACALERAHVLRLLDFNFGLPGLIRGDRVIGVLRELVGDHDIEDLPMAFTAVATDLETQREVWLNRGKLFDAVRASIAIPMLFTPHVLDGRELVDGGLLAPLPIAPTRLNRVDHVIAVDVNGPVSWRLAELERARIDAGVGADPGPEMIADEDAETSEDAGIRARIAALWSNWRGAAADTAPVPRKRSMLDLMARSLDTMHAHMTRMHLAQDPPDLLIQIPSNICAIYEYWRSREMIDLGREAAERAVAKFG